MHRTRAAIAVTTMALLIILGRVAGEPSQQSPTAGASASIVAQDASHAPIVLPTDPLQRIAYRAVILDAFPGAPAWKLDAYKRVLQRGITADKLCRRTNYCPNCSGTRCADGSRVRPGICAASKNIPMHSIVWVASDGLLKVTDRGGLVKPHPRSGEAAHFDVWQRSCGATCQVGTRKRVPYAVIRRGEGPRHADHPR